MVLFPLLLWTNQMSKKPNQADEFELYDLKVVVESIEGHCT